MVNRSGDGISINDRVFCGTADKPGYAIFPLQPCILDPTPVGGIHSQAPFSKLPTRSNLRPIPPISRSCLTPHMNRIFRDPEVWTASHCRAKMIRVRREFRSGASVNRPSSFQTHRANRSQLFL